MMSAISPKGDDAHAMKIDMDRKKHEKVVQHKHGARLERHSGTGHSIKEQPKKGGAGGKTVWGSYKDDVKDFMG